MKLQFRLLLFLLLLFWSLGIFFEYLIKLIPNLIFAYSFIYKTYSTVCHQEPTKLINIGCGNSLVCARCTGIYIALFTISFVNIIHSIEIKPSQKLLLLLSGPMIIDVVLTSLNIYEYNKSIAFITGVLFGSILFLYFYNGIKLLLKEIWSIN